MKKRKFFNNLIGIPLIAMSMLFGLSTKSEASIADFVNMMQSKNNISSVEQSNINARLDVDYKYAKVYVTCNNSYNLLKYDFSHVSYAGYSFAYASCNSCGGYLPYLSGSHYCTVKSTWITGVWKGYFVPVTDTDGGSSGSGSSSGGSSSSGGGSSGSTPSTPSTPSDTTAPTCTITASPSSATNANQITYTIKFSESVSGFEKADLTFSGGTANVSSFSGSGSSYTAVVDTEDNKEYTLKLNIGAGVCKDSAGNNNTASNTVEVPVDRIKPVVKFTGNKNTTYISKDSEVNIKFTATDNKYSKTTLTASDILIKVGDKQITPTKKELSNPTTIEKGVEYTLTLSGITGDGKLVVTVPAGKIQDTAGNYNIATSSTNSNGIDNDLNIIVDNSKPEIKSVTIANPSNNNGYAKNGDTVKVTIEFTENISNTPIVKIGGREANVTGSGTKFVAEYKIPNDETTLLEGELSVEISNYTDKAGLTGDKATKTTDGSKIIYDRTAPKIGNISPNGNTTWQKSQSTVIDVSDNFTANNDIKGEYNWVIDGGTSSSTNTPFSNQAKITKDTGTGKYSIYLVVRDLAGNETMFITNPFYIDNSLTSVGTLKITKNSAIGEEYKTHSKSGENGEYFEGGYASENLYIHKVDGTDNESGHKSTVYVVTKLEDGKEIAVGKESVEDTIIETDGDYKITVTTTDNLGHTGTRVYIIHKGSVSVTFSPNSNNSYELEVSTTVTLKDTIGLTDKMYYEWVKEGEEPKNFSNEIKSGDTVKLSGVTGEYVLYVKTVDSDGNVSFVKSGVFKLTTGITNVGTMMFKYNDAQGANYVPDTFTKENIYMRLKDQGSDLHGGKVTSTYKVTKKIENGNIISIGEYTNESTVLTSEGEYTVTVTSKNELGVTATRTYKVKIDKTSPEITFSGLDTYNQTGRIQVTVTDKGLCPSGVNKDSLKYYWTRSTNTPTKQDFEGSTEGGYRGKLSSANSIVKAPKGVSGIWYLWVYAEDNAGNATIKSNVKIEGGNVSYIDNEAPIAGSLKLTEIIEGTEETKTYQENTYTANSVKIQLLNGYDADSGVKSNTYSIMKNGKSYKNNLTEDTVLQETGVYTAVVTTIDNQNNQSTRSYTIKIDKQGPEVKYTISNISDYSKKKEVQVSIVDSESGLDTTKTLFKWIGYNPELYKDIQEVLAKIDELQKSAGENYISELAKIGIIVKDQEVSTGKISTPEGATGIYHLYVYAKDKVGNKTVTISEALKLDNTNPTKPQIEAYEKETLKPYYGSITRKEIQIEAKGSYSLSGVDQYMYSVSKDNGLTWSEWKQANYDGKVATVVISEDTNIMIKMKAVAVLLDGTLESQESDEIIVRIDTKGPNATFANYKTGENGTTEYVKDILVRATITDQNSNSVNPNTLKYEWVKFADINEYNQFSQKTKTLEELKNKMTNEAKSFANGEELPSPKDVNGIYSLFVYAEDMTGNASVNYSNAYRLGIEGETDDDSEEFIIGDLNGDKLVDLIDLSRLQQHIIGNRQLESRYLKEADINQDGNIDIIDLSRLMLRIAGLQ